MQNDIMVSIDYLHKVRLGLMSLKHYIDQMPPDNPVVWIGDQKTPVKQLPDYRYATQVLAETEDLLRIKPERRITRNPLFTNPD